MSFWKDSVLLRKVLTRLVWYWERKRSYPIREKIWNASPVDADVLGDCALAVLTTSSHAEEAAWCLKSVLRVLPQNISLKIIVDGEWKKRDSDCLKKLFPRAIFQSTNDYVQRFKSRYPEIFALSKRHPMGRKLLAILGLQEDSDVIYCDDDILAFDKMPEVNAWLEGKTTGNLYLQDVGAMCADAALYSTVARMKLAHASTINVGFLLIRRNSLKGELAEETLRNSPPVASWFPDTVLLSVMMGGEENKALNRERYVVSAARQFYYEEDVDYAEIALRHFTQPVRHVMYLKGMPLLWKWWNQ